MLPTAITRRAGESFSDELDHKHPPCDADGKPVQPNICHVTEITAQKIQAGHICPASVIGQCIADQLAGQQRRRERVGKHFYRIDC